MKLTTRMPEYVITRAMQILNEDGKALRGRENSFTWCGLQKRY